MYKIDNFNRDIVIERYVEDIVGGMNFIEVKEKLKDLLIKEKWTESNSDLETEVAMNDPKLLANIYMEELMSETYS